MITLYFLLNTCFGAPPKMDTVSGFRMGYGYAVNEDLPSPHIMVVGWDHMQSMNTGTALDFIIAGNISMGGMNQGRVLPSAHLIVGYQIYDSLQFGLGPVVTLKQNEVEPIPKLNMIIAGGWNFEMGDVYIPLHVAYVPDINGEWRSYVTTGINWPIERQ